MTSKILQQMVNDRTPGFDVVELQRQLNAVRKSKWRESSHRKKTTFSPSVIGFGYGTCPRYWYYAFKGAYFDEKFKPESAEAMTNGTASHERIEKIYAATDLGARIEEEVLSDDPPIRGFADVIVNVKGVEAVGDYKTINSTGFHYKLQSQKPSESHYLQVLIYMRILELDNGFLHYQCKDSHQELFIPIVMTKRAVEYVDQVFDWMRVVHKNKELPERHFTKTSVACRYCPLSKACWKDEEGDVDIPLLKVVKP